MRIVAKEKGVIREGNYVRFPGAPHVMVELPEGEWHIIVHVGATRVRIIPHPGEPVEIDGDAAVQVWRDDLDGGVTLVFPDMNTRIHFNARRVSVSAGLDSVEFTWEELNRA